MRYRAGNAAGRGLGVKRKMGYSAATVSRFQVMYIFT